MCLMRTSSLTYLIYNQQIINYLNSESFKLRLKMNRNERKVISTCNLPETITKIMNQELLSTSDKDYEKEILLIIIEWKSFNNDAYIMKINLSIWQKRKMSVQFYDVKV